MNISAPWMTAPPVRAVLTALGAPDTDVRFVGGCVRDAILGRPITDIDLATPDIPDVIVAKLESAGLKAVPTGLIHGTITAVAGGQGFEVTTLRRDTACDGRHAAVEFTTNWQEDASRRDFTFNAMSLCSDGQVFDPFGGAVDAKAGRVRFVGEPKDRIQEDYLRILRYFRFLASHGRAAPDPKTLKACKDLRSGLTQLSAERVAGEFVKLLSTENPLLSVHAMASTGVLKVLFAGARVAPDFEKLISQEGKFDVSRQTDVFWLTRWIALMSDSAVDAAAAMKFSVKQCRILEAIIAAAKAAPESQVPPNLYRYVHEHVDGAYGAEVALAGIRLASARAKNDELQDWSAFYRAVQDWPPMIFPLMGKDVQNLGVPQGPEIGQLLDAVKVRWIEEGFTASKAELIRRLKDNLH